MTKRTSKPLTRKNADSTNLAHVISSMSPNDLLWATVLPDHSEHAKRAISEHLLRAGHSIGEIETWRPPCADLRVPADEIKDRCKAFEDGRSRSGALFVIFRVVMLCLALLTVALTPLDSAVRNVGQVPGSSLSGSKLRVFLSRIDASVNAVQVEKIRTRDACSEPVVRMMLLRDGPLTDAVCVAETTVAPLGVLLSFALIFLAGSRKIASRLRFVALRPFGDKSMSTPLRRFILRNLAFGAQGYTLSDQNYRPNTLITIFSFFSNFVSFLLSPFIRQSVRIATVTREADFHKLRKSIITTRARCARNFVCGGQLSNVRTSDEWWKLSVETLICSSDFVIVDLSLVKSGSKWEIEQLRRRGFFDRSLFICQRALRDEGLQALVGIEPIPTVFLIDDDGTIENETLFREHLNAILSDRSKRAE
jgi:hypothetical protein